MSTMRTMMWALAIKKYRGEVWHLAQLSDVGGWLAQCDKRIKVDGAGLMEKPDGAACARCFNRAVEATEWLKQPELLRPP